MACVMEAENGGTNSATKNQSTPEESDSAKSYTPQLRYTKLKFKVILLLCKMLLFSGCVWASLGWMLERDFQCSLETPRRKSLTLSKSSSL